MRGATALERNKRSEVGHGESPPPEPLAVGLAVLYQAAAGMIDENAFGILISYFGIEDEEYADDDVSRFVERWREFTDTVTAFFVQLERPVGCKLVQLGHALYFEFPEPAEPLPVLSWVRDLRARLAERDYASVVVLAFGGRWVPHEDAAQFDWSQDGGLPQVVVSLPSEPLRRVLQAEAAAHAGMGPEQRWGPGFYADAEAIEALGLKPKNAPTLLHIGDAAFVRIGR